MCQFKDGNKYATTETKYGNGKIKPDVSINRR